MSAFEFANRKISLEFPNGKYELVVDNLTKSRAQRTAEWMISESKRLSSQPENISKESAAKMISAVTKELCKKIDGFLGDNAHAEILGERRFGDEICVHQDVCDVMGYILGEIQSAWDEMRTSRKTKSAKK